MLVLVRSIVPAAFVPPRVKVVLPSVSAPKVSVPELLTRKLVLLETVSGEVTVRL